MNRIILILLFLSTSSFAMTPQLCIKHVENHMDTLSICGAAYFGEIKTFKVNSCKKDKNRWICDVYQEPWPSSDCSMEIILDEYCYFNISTRITRENREDM
ncbi:MAG: hypothetical protein GY756_24850 [bacterium]|nr:hypothetical protein [bacterium]